MRSLLEVFCDVDDFCQVFLPAWQRHLVASGSHQRQRPRQLCLSEIMTILIAFHQSHYRTFKAFYTTPDGFVSEFSGPMPHQVFFFLPP